MVLSPEHQASYDGDIESLSQNKKLLVEKRVLYRFDGGKCWF
jgi:hypothetical protein